MACGLGLVLALAGLGLLPPAYGRSATDPQGLWLTASGNAVVRVAACGPDMCGQIVGLVLTPGEAMPRGWNGAPQCGLTIFRTAPVPGGQPVWSGSVLDPRNGHHYGARITMGRHDRLKLRGFVALPLFGQTESWTRYRGAVPADCRLRRGR